MAIIPRMAAVKGARATRATGHLAKDEDPTMERERVEEHLSLARNTKTLQQAGRTPGKKEDNYEAAEQQLFC